MFIKNGGDAFTQSLIGVWDGVVSFIPWLILAIVIFLIGWLLAVLIERLIESVFKTLRVDSLLKSAGADEVVERSGYKLNSGRFIGGLVKWFIIAVSLVAAFDVLGLNQVNSFLRDVVLGYLPNVIVAVLFLMIAVIIGDAVQKLIVASARAAHVKSAVFLGKVAKWAIWIIAILTALLRLGLDAGPINTIFIGLVAALALASGLAFGLGCKEQAGELVRKISHDIAEKN